MDILEEEIARLPILGVDATVHELRDTWAGGPAVLAFVRHFG
jgi:hypothetical protein